MNFERHFGNNYSHEVSPNNKNRYKEKDGPEKITRREFITKAGLLLIGAAALKMFGPKNLTQTKEKEETLRQPIERHLLKKLHPDLGYVSLYKEPHFEGLVLPGKLNETGYLSGSLEDILDGTIIRSLRYQNITAAAETKYNLPHNILLAMVAQESYGYNPLLNALGDGGAGLCHMQGMTAKEYNIKRYKDCGALVCDGKSEHSCQDRNGKKLNHGNDLKELVERKNSDVKELISYDDRFHPIINIDAAARMIAFYLAGSDRSGLGPLERAMKRYSGRDVYWEKVKELTSHFNDKIYLRKVEQKFNLLNVNSKMNGQGLDFNKYIEECQKQNLNYELKKYQSSTLYCPKNSNQVVKNFHSI